MVLYVLWSRSSFSKASCFFWFPWRSSGMREFHGTLACDHRKTDNHSLINVGEEKNELSEGGNG